MDARKQQQISTSKSENSSTVHNINCAPCRRRKSKCDRREPCSSCILRQSEAYCYTSEEPPAPSNRSVVSSGSNKRTPDSQSEPNKIRKINGSGTIASKGKASSKDAAQMAIENITSSMEVLQGYITEKRLMSNESILSSVKGTMIEWEDLLSILPPLEDIRKIIHCYFSDLTGNAACVHRERFEAMWADAELNQIAIPCHRASLLCSIIALVCIMTPKYHAAARLPKTENLDHKVQRENSRLLLECYYRFGDDGEVGCGEYGEIEKSPTEVLLQLEAETTYCTYSCSAGLKGRSWYAIGRAIRLGKSLGIFEEGKFIAEEWEYRMRRTIAWDLAVMDRWTSMASPHTLELGLRFKVKEPLYEPESYLHYRNTMTDHLARVIDFMHTNQSMDMTLRADYADEIAQHFRLWEASLPVKIRYDSACSSINSNDPNSLRLAAKALMFHSSSNFALCILMRPFLMDSKAPPHLRFAALIYARKIIESMHVLVTLCNCPWVSFPPAWNAFHLFASATTFATVFLSESKEDKEKEAWPAENLDWFASILFEVVDTFDLVAQGTQHHTARICKDLLVALCNSKEALKDRFKKRGKQLLRPSTPIIFGRSDSQADVNLDPALRLYKAEPVFSHSILAPPIEQVQDVAMSSSNNNNTFESMFDNLPFLDTTAIDWARLIANLDTQVV